MSNFSFQATVINCLHILKQRKTSAKFDT